MPGKDNAVELNFGRIWTVNKSQINLVCMKIMLRSTITQAVVRVNQVCPRRREIDESAGSSQLLIRTARTREPPSCCQSSNSKDALMVASFNLEEEGEDD